MKERIVITLVNDSQIDVQAFCRKIGNDGFEVEKIHSFGVITGKIEVGKLEKLREYQEVEDAKVDKEINLPPSDASIQ